MATITLRVITPERIVLDTTAREVKFPGIDGSVGVLPRHAPMVTALDAGALTWTDDDGRIQYQFVAGGFAEVRGNTVRLVTEASEPASDIDVDRAAQAAERARERMRHRTVEEGTEEFDVLRAEASMRRALMRRFVAGKVRA